MRISAPRIAALLATLLVLAVPRVCSAQRLVGAVTVEFVGTSTLHDFHGAAPPLPIAVDADGPRWQAMVAVPVATLDTGDADRDENMRAMFAAAHAPEIRVALSAIDADAVRRTQTLPFVLTIGATSRDTTATVAAWREAGDHLAFDASFPVSLRAFALEAPRAALGLIRVDDAVQVTVHVSLRRA